LQIFRLHLHGKRASTELIVQTDHEGLDGIVQRPVVEIFYEPDHRTPVIDLAVGGL
jgi:hypothetical protein